MPCRERAFARLLAQVCRQGSKGRAAAAGYYAMRHTHMRPRSDTPTQKDKDMDVNGRNKYNRATRALSRWWQGLVELFFPRLCLVCGKPLIEGEKFFCLHCDIDMPRTGFHLRPDNAVKDMFWGLVTVERATAYLYYRRKSGFSHTIHLLKYGGRPDIGVELGRAMAAELSATGFFEGIDVLVPVPLHRRKQRQRGYNQSEQLANGVATVTGLPVETGAVERCKDTASQTHKSVYERWENVEGIFRLLHPERLAGRHVLLIDDVLTTGATLCACAEAVAQAPGVSISILALATASDG